jgi:hypothetical protein
VRGVGAHNRKIVRLVRTYLATHFTAALRVEGGAQGCNVQHRSDVGSSTHHRTHQTSENSYLPRRLVIRGKKRRGGALTLHPFSSSRAEIPPGQPTLPRIWLISSRSNARIVVLRTLPAEPNSSNTAERLSASGGSVKPTRSWAPTV